MKGQPGDQQPSQPCGLAPCLFRHTRGETCHTSVAYLQTRIVFRSRKYQMRRGWNADPPLPGWLATVHRLSSTEARGPHRLAVKGNRAVFRVRGTARHFLSAHFDLHVFSKLKANVILCAGFLRAVVLLEKARWGTSSSPAHKQIGSLPFLSHIGRDFLQATWLDGIVQSACIAWNARVPCTHTHKRNNRKWQRIADVWGRAKGRIAVASRSPVFLLCCQSGRLPHRFTRHWLKPSMFA